MRKVHRLASLLLVLALVAAACGGDDGDDGGSADGSGGDNSIVISGSSTVQPISVAIGDSFGGDADITVDGPGTGDGFQLFCTGETDISDASRPIDTEEEVPLCEENGVDFIELKVGIDGIAVLTSADNTAVECLAFADLYALVGPESEGFESWSDADDLAADVAAPNAPYPDAPLDVSGPGEESGTYDSFVEIALSDIAEQRVEEGAIEEDVAEATRPDYNASPDDNQIIAGIEGSDSSLGWVGFGVAEIAGDSVRAIPVSDGEGDCVEPTAETIQSTEYPISRFLYIYVNAQRAEEKPVLAEFVDYYVNDGLQDAVEGAGYVMLADEDVEATRQAWESRATGTSES